MSTTKLVTYDFDEEEFGFHEPNTPDGIEPGDGLGPLSKLGLAMVALGLLAGVLLSLQLGSFSEKLSGTWLGCALVFGSVCIGLSLHFLTELKGTTPGIKHDGVFFKSLTAAGAVGWMLGVFMTAAYIVIYWYPQWLGETENGPTGLVKVVDPVARWLQGTPADRWFLYGVLYTCAIAVYAVRMLMKYRHNRYQILRTLSVTASQLFLAWLLPGLLYRMTEKYVALNGVWPLNYYTLWPGSVDGYNDGSFWGYFIIGFLILGVVATPILTYFFGKRWYCSWICGCGGLAETLGDPWRQLSSKSTTSWKIERWLIHSVLVFIVVTTVALWAVQKWNVDVPWAFDLQEWYGFYIGAIFSGVIGVGFYPLMGSRVWCRFGCPQAAILGIFQRFFSRFRITTNGGQCMSCGNCSTYCEMGIDVRAYAQRGENIVRASCVGCGVCSAVCPRGVLKLENGSHGDRFEGSDKPVKALVDSFKKPDIYGYKSWPESKQESS